MRRQTDIRELAAAAQGFRRRLETIKRAHVTEGWGWYPYDTFSTFEVLVSMLRGEHADVLALAETHLLDIGCGDGDLSFLFESLGVRVTAIENPRTNYNRALGFQALKAALGSAVELRVCDLDAGFDLGGRTYGLALAFGLLYHLKNPFGFLESLARHSRYAVISTRIAEQTVRGTRIAAEPLAYLVDPAETNNDPTNFWIFSETGLRRVVDRAGWDVLEFTTRGVRHGSDPARADRDQRAFAMLRSRMPDPWAGAELEDGWYAMEAGGWRWTGRAFSARVECDSERPVLRFEFVVPEPVFARNGPVRIWADVSGVRLPELVCDAPGRQVYEQPVAAGSGWVTVRFELDKGYVAPEGRELGVQVVFWNYDEDVPRALRPIRIT